MEKGWKTALLVMRVVGRIAATENDVGRNRQSSGVIPISRGG
jgi:hypothetical protein